MKNLNIIIAAASLVFTGMAQAETFNINLTSGNTTIGYAALTATDDGGGTFTATSGTLTITNLDGGATFTLDPVPTNSSTVTIHGIVNSGGGDLFGDNLVINDNLDDDGLIFTNPPTTINGNGFTGDVYNLWGNGGNSFTLAYAGPHFPSGGITQENLTGSVVQDVPEPSSWALMLVSLG